MPRKKSAGRPPLPPAEKASRRMGVNFKPADMEKVDRAAKLEGAVRTGNWIASLAVERAQEVIAKAERRAAR